MSDQDFFFDEEEETPKPAVKASSKGVSKGAVKASGSEQKSAPKPAARPAAKAASPSIMEQNVSMTVAALMTVIGLLVGVIIGFVLAPDSVGAGSSTTEQTSEQAAPTLSEDQLNSGQLPAGHPDISGAATSTPSGQ